jgi:DNA primase
MVKTAGRFRRGLLPPAKTFFEREIGRLTRPTAKGWALGRCPFHPSKSGKSLSVNIRTGAWCCFGCGAKGDLISFVRKRYSLSFRDAAIYLKAIDTDTTPAHVETLKAADLERQREREAETAWELLALLHTERAEAELTYCELAGLEFDKP